MHGMILLDLYQHITDGSLDRWIVDISIPSGEKKHGNEKPAPLVESIFVFQWKNNHSEREI
jgi:hypothetical protein